MKTAFQLIEELSALGFRLTVEENTLLYDAPDNDLTRSWIPEIRRQKPAIIDALLKESDYDGSHVGTDRLEQETVPSWDDETVELIRWFQDEGQHQFPKGPCKIGRVPLQDPQRRRAILLEEISLGPDSWRAQSGDLISDLRWLRRKLPAVTSNSGISDEN